MDGMCAAPHWEGERAPLSPDTLVLLGKMVLCHLRDSPGQAKMARSSKVPLVMCRGGGVAWREPARPRPWGWGQRPSGEAGAGL